MKASHLIIFTAIYQFAVIHRLLQELEQVAVGAKSGKYGGLDNKCKIQVLFPSGFCDRVECSCLRIIYLFVPYSYPVNHDVAFTCEYDLEGDTLYAIKWFHEDEEFYRFCPTDDPSTTFFPTHDIKLDLRRTTNKSVGLKNIQRTNAGKYRCEVLADAPHFKTATAEASMIVGDFYNGRQKCSYTSSSTIFISLLLCIAFYFWK